MPPILGIHRGKTNPPIRAENEIKNHVRQKWNLGASYRIDGVCDFPILNSFFSRCQSHVPASLVEQERKSEKLTAWDKK